MNRFTKKTATASGFSFYYMLTIGEISYWDKRYEDEQTQQVGFRNFDWYCPFNKLYPEICSIVDTSGSHRILVIGVGKSNIIECLYKKGFRDITAIDISSVVIQQMQREYATYTGVEFFVMDVRELIKFPDNYFSLIFDKGCIDTLFCGTDFISSTKKAFSEIYRVMRKESTFVLISHASPRTRVPFLRSASWAVECYKLDEEIGESLTMYTLMKTTNILLLNKRIKDGDLPERSVNANISTMENKTSSKSGRGGSLSVTSNTDALDEMLAESAERDG